GPRAGDDRRRPAGPLRPLAAAPAGHAGPLPRRAVARLRTHRGPGRGTPDARHDRQCPAGRDRRLPAMDRRAAPGGLPGTPGNRADRGARRRAGSAHAGHLRGDDRGRTPPRRTRDLPGRRAHAAPGAPGRRHRRDRAGLPAGQRRADHPYPGGAGLLDPPTVPPAAPPWGRGAPRRLSKARRLAGVSGRRPGGGNVHLVEAWMAALPPLTVYAVVAVVIGLESMGVPLPGEFTLVGASLLAISGVTNPWLVGFAAATGAIVGDSIGYAVGRRGGRAMLD